MRRAVTSLFSKKKLLNLYFYIGMPDNGMNYIPIPVIFGPEPLQATSTPHADRRARLLAQQHRAAPDQPGAPRGSGTPRPHGGCGQTRRSASDSYPQLTTKPELDPEQPSAARPQLAEGRAPTPDLTPQRGTQPRTRFCSDPIRDT